MRPSQLRDGSSVTYTYDGGNLTQITYPGGRSASLVYNEASLPSSVTLKDESGNAKRRTEYTYSGSRILTVKEFGIEQTEENGAVLDTASLIDEVTFQRSTASRSTRVTTITPPDTEAGETENSEESEVYLFSGDGFVIGEYTEGQAAYSENLLTSHGFADIDGWIGESANLDDISIKSSESENYAKYGTHLLRIQSFHGEAEGNGVYRQTVALSAGAYTFSAYARVINEFIGDDTPGIYIRVTKTDGTVLAESERLTKRNGEYIRLSVSFELATGAAVLVHILADGCGTAYFDGAQLEAGEAANSYNLLENGSFEKGGSFWTMSTGAEISAEESEDRASTLKIWGDIDEVRYAYQDVEVKKARGTKELFTLSGWAKGNALSVKERRDCAAPTFRLRAEIKYYDAMARRVRNRGAYSGLFTVYNECSLLQCSLKRRNTERLNISAYTVTTAITSERHISTAYSFCAAESKQIFLRINLRKWNTPTTKRKQSPPKMQKESFTRTVRILKRHATHTEIR